MNEGLRWRRKRKLPETEEGKMFRSQAKEFINLGKILCDNGKTMNVKMLGFAAIGLAITCELLAKYTDEK